MFIFTSERNRGVLSVNVVAGECNVKSSVCKQEEVARSRKKKVVLRNKKLETF